jgi:hypothetical protein
VQLKHVYWLLCASVKHRVERIVDDEGEGHVSLADEL